MKIMVLEFWIALRFLKSPKTLFGGAAMISFIGLSIGVAALFVSMAVVGGFEQSLQQSMSEGTGHVQIVRKAMEPILPEDFEESVRKVDPSLIAATPFLRTEALLVAKKSVKGVLIQGVDPEKAKLVLDFSKRVVEGRGTLSSRSEVPEVIIGKGIFKKMSFHLNDLIKLVVPISSEGSSDRFRRQVMQVKIVGIVDFGKNEWNERFFISDIKVLQKLTEIGDRYHGLLLRYPSSEQGLIASDALTISMGTEYWVSNWRNLNENLFDAIALERIVIFFVVMVIIVVAAFSISSSLFVNILRRYPEIAILKAAGMNRMSIIRIFSMQGLMIGALSILLGFSIGLILCFAFMYLQSHFSLMDGSVYKLDTIGIAIRFVDMLVISLATLFVTLVASLAPAIRGAKIQISQGIRYG